jgi:polysaccharide biosynthesis protein PslJ
MQVVLAARPQDGARSWFLVAAASALLAVGIAAGGGTAAAAGVAATTMLASAFAVRRPLVPWERLLALLVLVILFVPIRRYELPIEIGFQLEPYRVLVALIVLAWLASLLVDSRVRLRSTGFERPLGLILVAVFASVIVNPGRFGMLECTVVNIIKLLLIFMVVQ